jgi:hypothetical protein
LKIVSLQPWQVSAVKLSVAIAMLLFAYSSAAAQASNPQESIQEFTFSGLLVAPDGNGVANATIRLSGRTATTDRDGRFRISAPAGSHLVGVAAANYQPLTLELTLTADVDLVIEVQPSLIVTIRPEPDALSPDPSTRILVRENVLDANPGRPGVPVSVPGLPAETASGGIKAPQYFAPGVAGDHGEPIAQYLQIGDLLFQNNLSANAHGNGYADPNVLVPAVIGSVQTDGGAFNVRHGNHAIDLAVAFGLRERLEPFAQVIGDAHDFDLVAGWSPRNLDTHAWLSTEISFGDGFLKRPESRQQYKINGYRVFTPGRHRLTLLGIGYYGFSRIPGLVPTDLRVPGDTIDPNQLDLTHTTLISVADTWTPGEAHQVLFAGYFRTYSLRLQSNFGDGLIRQSEFRTVAGGSAMYLYKPRSEFSLLAGFDIRRDAPRDLQLSRADQNGIFQPVTGNDLTFTFLSPYLAVDGTLLHYLRYNLGARRDEVNLDNSDRLNPANSFSALSGITTPRATATLLAPREYLPSIAVSFGEAFHTNDPRIGSGPDRGTIIARSRAYQLVITEVIHKTEFRIALAHVTNDHELAKIDPDTGLQEDVGPSLVRSVTASVRRDFSFGSLQASFSRANAIDRLTGADIPEAPRLIWDLLGTAARMPLKLQAKFEFEYVGRKPLGGGFTAGPVREFRGSILRPFAEGRLDAGVYFFIARGFTGQTLETRQLPGEPAALERIVGVRLKSYASVGLTYRFRHVR